MSNFSNAHGILHSGEAPLDRIRRGRYKRPHHKLDGQASPEARHSHSFVDPGARDDRQRHPLEHHRGHQLWRPRTWQTEEESHPQERQLQRVYVLHGGKPRTSCFRYDFWKNWRCHLLWKTPSVELAHVWHQRCWGENSFFILIFWRHGI